MKSPIRWLRRKLEYRRLIKQLSNALGDRKLILIMDDEQDIMEIRKGRMKNNV